MASAELYNGDIWVESSYTEKDLMTQIPGGRWSREEKAWKLHLSWAACQQLRGVFGAELKVGPALTAWAWQEFTYRIDPAMYWRDKLVLDADKPGDDTKYVRQWIDRIEADSELTLRDFQRVDVLYLFTRGQAILAAPPGLGKTAVAIRTMQVLHAMGLEPYPALVVCPNSLKHTVWARELERWAPELSVSVVDGGAVTRRKQIAETADVTVINYESMRLHTHIAGYGTIRLSDKDKEHKELNELGPRTVICDEAHRLRDPQTVQTRAAWALLHDAEYRYLLTGTPINNHAGDLWSLLHAILPDWFPAKTKYLDRYCEIGYNWFGGTDILGLKAQNQKEFRSVTEPVMRRIPKEAALPQLPPKLPIQYRETPMTPKQTKAYRQMETNLLAFLDDATMVAAPTALAKLTRLVQFASAYAEINEDGDLKLTTPSSKVDDLLDLLDEMGDEPLVVAAVSRQLIELASAALTDKGIPHGMVTGAQSVPMRAMAVNDFQEGKTRVILLTLGAGAEGLTLTRADTMLFMQRSFSPLENQQAEDRIHRIGAEHHDRITIIEQITPGTVEESKRDLLEAKGVRIEEVLRDKEMLRRLLG
jgi:SNF2 family DNA or RNA helicase